MGRSDEEDRGIPDLPEKTSEQRQTSVQAEPVKPEPALGEPGETQEQRTERAMEEDRRSRRASADEGEATDRRRDEPGA